MNLFYINGYGATPDVNDGNYGRYLSRAYAEIQRQTAGDRCLVILSGGHTNRTDLTEAETMRNWFKAHCPNTANLGFVLLDDVDSLEKGLEAASLFTEGRPVTVFCEMSRRRHTRFLVRRYLGRHAHVVPIKFDIPSMRLKNQLLQATVRYPLTVLGFYFKPVQRINRGLRRAKIALTRAGEK